MDSHTVQRGHVHILVRYTLLQRVSISCRCVHADCTITTARNQARKQTIRADGQRAGSGVVKRVGRRTTVCVHHVVQDGLMLSIARSTYPNVRCMQVSTTLPFCHPCGTIEDDQRSPALHSKDLGSSSLCCILFFSAGFLSTALLCFIELTLGRCYFSRILLKYAVCVWLVAWGSVFPPSNNNTQIQNTPYSLQTRTYFEVTPITCTPTVPRTVIRSGLRKNRERIK